MERAAVLAALACTIGCGAAPVEAPRRADSIEDQGLVEWPTLIEGVRAARIFPGAVPCIEDEHGEVMCVHTREGFSLYVGTLHMFASVHTASTFQRPSEPAMDALLRSPWALSHAPFDAPAWSPSSPSLITTRFDGGCAVLDDAISVRCRVMTDRIRPMTGPIVRMPVNERIVEIDVSSEGGPWLTDCYGATWPQGHHYCARLESGRVACWGENGVGQRGDGTRVWPSSSGRPRAAPLGPGLVRGIDDAVEVALGMHHGCALHRTGRVSCWGYNLEGQLGDGTRETRLTPVEVVAVDDVVSVSAADRHTCALGRDGRVLCWGATSSYGTPDRAAEEGVLARYLSLSEPAVEVVAAGSYTCARSAEGRVYCGGRL